MTVNAIAAPSAMRRRRGESLSHAARRRPIRSLEEPIAITAAQAITAAATRVGGVK